MRHTMARLLGLAGVTALVLGMSASADAERSGDQEFLIITTASNRGEVDPCG